MCINWPNCGHISPYSSTRIGHYENERQTTLDEFMQPNVCVEPYSRGMDLDGGLKLYGWKSTAILHDPDTGVDIHHHNNGAGSLNFGSKRLLLLDDD
jgi:hypothetical protein